MRLLYAEQTFCDLVTLKRLLLVADEIAFADRPAVTFKSWGLVGHESRARAGDGRH